MEISQEHGFISDILKDVQKGRLFPAAFQRPYVWDKSNVEAMWESVHEEFPMGAFFIWNPWGACDLNEFSRGRLGPIMAEDQEEQAVGMILDGQNRLASFAWSMADNFDSAPDGISDVERETWMSGLRLVADFEEKRMHFVPAEEAETGLRVPSSVVCRSSSLMKYLRVNENYQRLEKAPEAIEWLDRFNHKIISARVVVTNANRATMEEAKSAFMKICRVGVPISDEDFKAAMEWSPPSDSALKP